MRRFAFLPALLLVLAWTAGVTGAPTPPPTPVPPAGSPSPFPTALATPAPTLRPPEIHAAAAILEDLDTGQVLFTSHPDDRRPIASTTKIMTALVVLERTEPSDVVTVSKAAGKEGAAGAGFSELGLEEREHLTVGQLLYALLLQSANDAAVALADHVAGSVDRFVHLMNRRARAMGIKRTKFYSPNGLDDRGYTTARSLATLTRLAFDEPEFSKVVRTRLHVVPAPKGEEPRHIQNRNVLLWLYPGAIGVKTGFTTAAGYCLVAAANRNGTRFVSVVLGEPTGESSFSDAAALLDYGFHAFVPHEVIEAGETLDSVRVRGVSVPVAAGRSLTSFVVADNIREPSFTFHVRVIRGSLSVGESVGFVSASLNGRVLGRVPIVATAVPQNLPPPPSPRPPPWWRRGLDSMSDFAAGVFHAVFG